MMRTAARHQHSWLSSVGQHFSERGSFFRRRCRHQKSSSASLSTFRKSQLIMMPEGPEVKVLVHQLQPAIGGRLIDWKFLSGRYADHRTSDGHLVEGDKPRGWRTFKNIMTQYSQSGEDNHNGDSNDDDRAVVDVIQDIACKGKFIYILLDKGGKDSFASHASQEDWQRSIWVTLGMTGRFVSQKVHEQEMTPTEQSKARWYMELIPDYNKHYHDDEPKRIRIYYYDTRNFGTLRFSTSTSELVDKLQSLGPDVLGGDKALLTRSDFFNLIDEQKPSLNVCKFLMNQQKISGVGNYILAEALYRAWIDPYASLQELSSKQRQDLYTEVMAVARESFESQIQKEENQQQRLQQTTSEETIKPTFQLQCYGRDRCARYGEQVIRDVNGPHGRTIWFTERQLFRPLQERDHYRLFNKIPGQTPQQESSFHQQSTRLPPPSQRRGQPAFDRDYASEPFRDPSHAQQQKAQSKRRRIENPDALSLDDAKVSLISGITDPSWKASLEQAVNTPSFNNLVKFLQNERQAGYTIFPPTSKDIFAALNACPLPRVRVIILGQDPYHGAGQAHGLAFSVKKGVMPPPSLRNIFAELQEEGLLLENKDASLGQQRRQTHGNLQHWANQGVLLLNTVLTVREGEANSHANQGWEDFTDAVIGALLDYNNDQGDGKSRGLVFLLWGNPAAKKASGCRIDSSRHTVIRTSHPSPLSARRTKSPFIGSQCFRKANDALVDMGHDPMDWSLGD